MTQNSNDEMAGLDILLEQTRARTPTVPPGLMERVAADGLRMQDTVASSARRLGLRRRFLDSLGGWPTLGGLAAASCAGFWIGVSPPEGLADPATLLFGGVFDEEEAIEMSGFGWDVQEG